MARPRKSDAEKRTERSEQRYTLAEIEIIREQAERAGMSPTDFIRRRALSLPVKAAPASAATDPALISELNRIGVNVNQLALSVHRGSAFSNFWSEIGDELTSILHKVAARYGS